MLLKEGKHLENLYAGKAGEGPQHKQQLLDIIANKSKNNSFVLDADRGDMERSAGQIEMNKMDMGKGNSILSEKNEDKQPLLHK